LRDQSAGIRVERSGVGDQESGIKIKRPLLSEHGTNQNVKATSGLGLSHLAGKGL